MYEHRDPSWLKDRRVIVLGIGCAMVGFLVALLIFGKPWHLPPDWGDIPTWLAVAVATIGGWTALSQLRQQQAVIQADIERQAKRDQLLDAQLEEAADWARARARIQAEAIEFSGQAKLSEEREPGASGVTRRVGRCGVDNNSPRPIWDVAPRLLVNGQTLPPASFREYHEGGMSLGGGWGPAADESVDEAAGSFLIMRAGKRLSARFQIPDDGGDPPPATYLVRFTDDAKIRWELGDDMHLRRAPDNDW